MSCGEGAAGCDEDRDQRNGQRARREPGEALDQARDHDSAPQLEKDWTSLPDMP
jgi:hypothetical protein